MKHKPDKFRAGGTGDPSVTVYYRLYERRASPLLPYFPFKDIAFVSIAFTAAIAEAFAS